MKYFSLILGLLIIVLAPFPVAAAEKPEDKTPPSLLAVEAVSGTYYPNGKALIAADACDDESGVKSITLYFEHAVSGKTLTVKLAENPGLETSREYAGELRIPADAESGVYVLRKAVVLDREDNRSTYRKGVSRETDTLFELPDNVSFTVAPKSAPPVLKSCEAEVRVNRVTIALSVQAGRELKSAVLLFENQRSGRKFTVSMNGDDLDADGIYRKRHLLSEYEPHGEFTLKQAILTGKDGAKINYSGNPDKEKPDEALLPVKTAFTVSGTKIDDCPPELLAFSIGKQVKDSGGEQWLYKLKIRAADNASGIEYITATFKNALTEKTAVKVLREADFTGKDNIYSGDLRMAFDSDKGDWRLDSVMVCDNAGNRKTWLRQSGAEKDGDKKSTLPFAAAFTI